MLLREVITMEDTRRKVDKIYLRDEGNRDDQSQWREWNCIAGAVMLLVLSHYFEFRDDACYERRVLVNYRIPTSATATKATNAEASIKDLSKTAAPDGAVTDEDVAAALLALATVGV